MSVGCSPLDPTVELYEAMRRADLAIYEAKQSGYGSMLWQGQD